MLLHPCVILFTGGWLPSMHHWSHDWGSASREGLHPGGSAGRVCMGGLHPEEGLHPGSGLHPGRGLQERRSAGRGSASREGSASKGVCIQGSQHPGGSVSRGVSIQGGLHGGWADLFIYKSRTKTF